MLFPGPQPQFGSGTVNYTVQPNTGSARNTTATVGNQALLIIQQGTTACQVEPLTPITDAAALAFENGNRIDTVNLTPNTNQARIRLENAIPGSQLLSAYRPTAYQQHLLEVWDKAEQLEGDTSQECAALRRQVLDERTDHQLGEEPARGRSAHEDGRAVDYNIQDTPTNRATAVSSGFLQNRIRRHTNGGLHLESAQ